MTALLGAIGVAVVVFATTNIDDLFLLAAFFADRRLRVRAVVAGQFLGIGALVAASAAVGLAALSVPESWVALLGLVPLYLGLKAFWDLRRTGAEDVGTAAPAAEAREEHGCRSQALAVAAVTIANGGDNFAVYVPLFARAPHQIPVHAIVFAGMTALWCAAGYHLVKAPWVGTHVRRYGHAALPFVLVALGLWILSDARSFFA